MNTKLRHIRDWDTLAMEAEWSVTRLAKMCGVSMRTIELYFLKQFRKAPKTWLTEQRQKNGMDLLCKGSAVKEAAAKLGYKHTQHFSRDFKEHWGYSPTEMADARVRNSHFGL